MTTYQNELERLQCLNVIEKVYTSAQWCAPIVVDLTQINDGSSIFNKRRTRVRQGPAGRRH